MDKQTHPTFCYKPPNLLFTKWAKKKFLPAFANLWLLLVLIIDSNYIQALHFSAIQYCPFVVFSSSYISQDLASY